jgi:hypothetical protein
MSSSSAPVSTPSTSASARPRRRYGWWVALAVAALLALLAYRFGGPAYGTLSFMAGHPYHPGCMTEVTRQETVGELWYRISEQRCANGLTMHYVFVARAQSTMSFLVTPAFMSIESPIPRSVSKQGARSYYIAIEPPLADGTDILETFIGPSGVPLTVHIYDKGQKRETR